jgi:autotransporter-associated beta strand protein
VINTPGAVNLMYATNTYSGGTIVNDGTVTCKGGYPVFGSGPVTFNPSARFMHDRNALTNRLTLNGTTLRGGNSFSTGISGHVTLQGITTFDHGGSGNISISGNISGSGGFRTQCSSVNCGLSLSGTNTYTGATTVGGGLFYETADSVAPGDLIINNGALVRLKYTGDRKIASLTLGGVVQPDGTYGSTASPATFKNDTYFSGKGTVTCGKK